MFICSITAKKNAHFPHDLGFKRPNMSRNTLWNCNFSLPFKHLSLKLQVIRTPLQKLG